MIEKAVVGLVCRMERLDLINNSMREHYIYALQVLLEKWLTVITIAVIGVICNQFIGSIIFLIAFLSLRARTGGFHAKRFRTCYVGTILTYSAVMCVVNICSQHVWCMDMIWGLLIISVAFIFFAGPVNHPNMKLSAEEMAGLKKSSRCVLLLECALTIILWMKNPYYATWVLISIILCAALLAVAKIIMKGR